MAGYVPHGFTDRCGGRPRLGGGARAERSLCIMSAVLKALRRHAGERRMPFAMVGDDTVLDYGVLAARVTEVAGGLFPVPACAGGLLLDNGIGWALVDLAARQTGAVLVPVAVLQRAADRHVLRTAGLDSLVTDQGERLAGVTRFPARDVGALLGQPAVLHAA